MGLALQAALVGCVMPDLEHAKDFCARMGHPPCYTQRELVTPCLCGAKTYRRLSPEERAARLFADEITRRQEEE